MSSSTSPVRIAYLLVGDAGVDDLLFELAEGLGVIVSLAFRLEQDDGANVASRLLPFPAGDELQSSLEQYGVLHHLALAVAAVDDDGKFDHLLLLELEGRYSGDHVRFG